MPVKIPAEVTTRHRDEMVCPNCFHEGLEPHPGYVEEFTGDAEIINATRCPNVEDECPYHFGKGVPADAVDTQYERESRFKSLQRGVDRETIGLGLLIAVGMLFLLQNVVGVGVLTLDGGGVDAAVAGAVVGPAGEPVPNATVSVVGRDSQARTNSSGQYRLTNLTGGPATVSVSPPVGSPFAAVGLSVRVGEDGTVTPTDRATTDTDGLSRISLQEPTTATQTVTGTNTTVIANFSNPANAANDGVRVTVSPPPGETIADSVSVQSGTTQQVAVPGVITSQQATLRTSVLTEDVVLDDTWTGETTRVPVRGTSSPDSLTVNVSQQSTEQARRVEQTVSDGAAFTTTVQGDTSGPITATVTGGSQAAQKTITGTYTGQNPTVDIDSQTAPAQVGVTVTGETTRTETTTTGTIANGVAAFRVAGTQPAQNTTISFDGGTSVNPELATETVRANASDGTTTTERALFTASEAGSYVLDFEYEVAQEPDLLEAGYKLNGTETTIDPATQQKTLTLASDDRVSVWMQAEQQSFSQAKSYTQDSPVDVTSQSVSQTAVDTGESTTVEVTMTNTGDSPYTISARLFTDGTEKSSTQQYFSVGQTKTFVAGEVSFAEAGTHTVSVNEGDQITVAVGDEPSPAGAGSLTATATQQNTNSTVTVDTTNDGSPDCTVSAATGSCSLGTLTTGQTQLAVSQDGVTDTAFTVSYTARTSPQTVRVDIDSDGVADIDTDQLDGQSLSETATLPAGTNALLFSVGNGEPIAYNITLTPPEQVTQPELLVDGSRVIDEPRTITGTQSYTIEALDAGSHRFEFASDNATAQHTLTLSWTERSTTQYPSTYVDGKQVCRPVDFAPTAECRITPNESRSTDGYSLRFDDRQPPFSYGVAYTAEATPTTATLQSATGAVTFRERTRDRQHPDGSWSKSLRPTLLQSGANRLRLNTASVDGLTPRATATVEYTYTAKKPTTPRVIVTNGTTTREKPLPETALADNGVLATTSTVTLPAAWFGFDDTEIRVVSSNGGVTNTTVTTTAARETVLADAQSNTTATPTE